MYETRPKTFKKGKSTWQIASILVLLVQTCQPIFQWKALKKNWLQHTVSPYTNKQQQSDNDIYQILQSNSELNFYTKPQQKCLCKFILSCLFSLHHFHKWIFPWQTIFFIRKNKQGNRNNSEFLLGQSWAPDPQLFWSIRSFTLLRTSTFWNPTVFIGVL